jgi:hypothetical protein
MFSPEFWECQFCNAKIKNNGFFEDCCDQCAKEMGL